MGYKYLIVDSQAAKQAVNNVNNGTSTLNIQLNHPIVNATSMRMMSFSSPNDFFNVRAHNDTFDCMLYNLSGTASIERKSYKIPLGLYSIGEIVNQLNVQASASPFSNMTPVFSLLATNKVQITCSSTGTVVRRFIIYSSNFHNSIAHRIGFNVHQVFTGDFASQATADWKGLLTGSVIGADRLFQYTGSAVSILNVPEGMWNSTQSNPLVWATDGVGQSFSGNNIGFESYQHLLMKCSLVTQDVESIYKTEDGVVMSRSDNILQKIETNVSTFSYLHWNAGINEPFDHSLSGKPVQSFSLELCDDAGKSFEIHESKHWSCVLRFETAAENDRVNELNSLQNQRLRFKSSHQCTR